MDKIPASIVIISFNAARTIQQCIESALKITDDIIVVDSGSTDNTQQIVKQLGATLIQEKWHGYSENKTIGNNAAKYDWILSLDSDEVLSEELIQSVRKINFDISAAYVLKRLNYFGNKPIHFGAFKNDWVLRIFNKNYSFWDNAVVHEIIVHNQSLPIIQLKGNLQHYTSENFNSFSEKQKKYAQLMADKYFAQGKKVTFIKCYFSPIFNFVQNYFFLGGFLDGINGFRLAIVYAKYTYHKYNFLKSKY
ncbi:MAG: glycosyltransferase family 2 protein [Chitinophagaceae bacterium]|nr:glycosyltransferase family 2 protein [Chitinophagaceae bacterium]MCW5904013.1 glycosyltransferase family 2 protein [Chitinophagaceae bacterium]